MKFAGQWIELDINILTIVDTSTESLGIFGISIEAKKLVRGLRGWVQGKECKMEVT